MPTTVALQGLITDGLSPRSGMVHNLPACYCSLVRFIADCRYDYDESYLRVCQRKVWGRGSLETSQLQIPPCFEVGRNDAQVSRLSYRSNLSRSKRSGRKEAPMNSLDLLNALASLVIAI